MSVPNSNCHVSTKWEDTGGDASVLLSSPNTNEDSLQELIDKELALRNTVASTNGIDSRPKSLLISGMDEVDTTVGTKKCGGDSFDIFNRAPNASPAQLENGCQRTNSNKASRGVAITEVDDFDVLYNEISTEDAFVNGHHTPVFSPTSSSPSSIDEKLEKIVNEDNQHKTRVGLHGMNAINGIHNNQHQGTEREPVEFEVEDCGPSSGQQVSSSEESSIDSVSVICNNETNKCDVGLDRFKINFTNEPNNDFVAVSEVDIVTESHEPISIDSSVADDQSTASASTIADFQKINEVEAKLEVQVATETEEISCIDDVNQNLHHTFKNSDLQEHEGDKDKDTKANSLNVKIESATEGTVIHEPHQLVPVESAEKSFGGEEVSRCNGDVADVKASTVNEREELLLEVYHIDDDYVHLGQYQVSGMENELVQKGEEGTGEDEAALTAFTTTMHMLPKCEPNQLIEECSYDLTMSDDLVCETSLAEDKSIKKKKSTSEETVTTSKTKKIKKTKKYEGKENISVTNLYDLNGIEDPNFHQIVDDCDELSNVCVRDLKIMYCIEAGKTTNGSKYEEPVPAPVPIKELTRSFGDLRAVNVIENPFYINNSKEGFGKFDQLTKQQQQQQKTMMHVRSSDSTKAQQQFSQKDASADNGNVCKACYKNVFAMEQIKAERHVWHKNCFRCKTCNKQLTVDVYSSHEGELYCKPHFRDLFKPTPVVEEESSLKLKKPELIIRENEPMELPADVVRASDKPDLGLEELSSLNVKSRFQVFERPQMEETTDKSPISVKRSPSILSKLAKFQAKGMDVGVSSDIFNGIDYEESSSSDEEPAHDDNITRSTVVKEKPMAFNKMNDVKMNWENGQTAHKEERREQRREEMQNIRSRMFMGKQIKMKEAYENAVAESERMNVKKDVEVKSDKARSIKEKFEKGEILHDESDDEQENKKQGPKNEDMEVFEAGISKKSRSIFQQMDAAIKTQSQSPVSSPQSSIIRNGHRPHKEMVIRQVSNDVVKASDPVENVAVQTTDISSKFKFFETYKAPQVQRKVFRITPPREGQLKSESPEREIHKDPDVVRCDEQLEDESEVLKKSNTTAKMLSLFRSMEGAQETIPDAPRAMKKFTPPPASSSTSEAESEDESEEQSEASNAADDIVRASDKQEDEYLKMAQKAAKAKTLKEKFERWEPEKQLSSNGINQLESEQANLDTTKSLRARFESLKAEQPVDKPRPKVNRFVDKSLPGYCDTCFKKVYPLEKVEAGDKVFHRNCFKCSRCNGILRMKTFTMNNGHLYCVPHFKQLFITKGNYDEGFGNHQHKAKWQAHSAVPVTNGIH